MGFPVDVLGGVKHEELEQEAEDCMTDLRYVSLDKAQSFTLSNRRKIRITLSNVGLVPIYGGDLKHRVLALFAPEDQLTAVALLLAGQWWAVDDILTTSDPSRTGLLQARSVVERIVLYVLNRIVYRVNEMDKPEVPFLCHGQHDFAKILWKDGQAVGFYSVKPKDSLCNHFVTQRYQLPVMDSIFVRKCHRGNGHGLEMLEDFVDSFKEDELGLKYPLSIPMYKLCSQYLRRYPADKALLWVVEGVGGPYQRESVAAKLSSDPFKVTQYPATANGDHGSENLEEMEMERTLDNCLNITEDVVVVNKPLKLIEDTEGTPVSTRTRSSESKRGREETEEAEDQSQPPKMSRLEDEVTEASVVAASEEEEEEEVEEEKEKVEEECSGPVEAEPPVAPEAPEEELVPGKEEPPALVVEEGNGELTDDQTEEEEEEEEEEDGRKGVDDEEALENGSAVEDVEMMAVKEEEEEEEEDVPQKINIDAVPVQSEDPIADPETTSPSEEEPALTQTLLTADPHPETAPSSGEMVEEAREGPPASLETDRPEEVSALTLEEEANSADLCQEEVLLVGVADLSYQPLEDQDIQSPTVDEKLGRPEEGEVGDERVAGEEEGKMEVEEEAVAAEERSSDGAGESLPVRRKGAGGRLAPKHTSKRWSQGSAKEGAEKTSEVTEVNEEEEEEEEEGEEEKALTIEEEADAADKTVAQEEEEEEEEEGDEEPPVVDQRALRRKSKPIKPPPKARGKRRSKT